MITTRRNFLAGSAAAWLTAIGDYDRSASAAEPFRAKYILGSCMYGYADIREILPEVAKTSSDAIDLWPKVHGSQREQLDEIGEEKFAELLRSRGVKLGCITQYKLGPFGLRDEMRLANRLGCQMIVTGGEGPINLKGNELKIAIRDFIEKLKPHLAIAEETGVTIAIENHAKNLIDSPDSMKYLAELRPSSNLGLAFAPYHLPQDVPALSKLIRDLGPSLSMFYAWEHGKGCMNQQPKEDELLQLPGRGNLDFGPLLKALHDVSFSGWIEIFMHPFPRGVPIMASTNEVTREINRSRKYLDSLVS